MQFWRRLLPWEILQWKMVLQEQAIFSETFRKEMGCSPADYRKWYRGLSDECPIITGENKEESAKVSKKDKKGKSGKNVPSYLL